MPRRLLLSIVPVLALTLAGGIAIGAAWRPVALAPASPAMAAAAPGDPVARTLSVTGEGRVAVKPDIAYVILGVETVNADLTQAQRENNTRMTAILDQLKARGIADTDLQTVGYNVYPQTDKDGKVTGYRVSNGVRATLRDINALGETIGQAIDAGATRVQGINFDLANKDDAIRRAREAAVNDARGKAEQLAKLTNVQLGAPVTVIEGAAPPPNPVRAPTAAASGAQRGGGDAPPVEAGEGFIAMFVQVTYEIR